MVVSNRTARQARPDITANKKRNILLITTDQMRFDALACNGGKVARTPTIDSLASTGLNYVRAHNQNVVCMPARATIITGQQVASHGVWMNGVALPEDKPTIAHHLQDHGYQTALLGKAHFEPWLGSADDFYENRMASLNQTGPHRGFHHMELANHFFEGHSHYDLWMNEHPHEKALFYPMITRQGQNTIGMGDTNACQVWPMDIPLSLYHTQWVADRTVKWLENQQSSKDPWFCWMSFPDPHHPWDIPQSELPRVSWRSLGLPERYCDNKAAGQVLGQKPKHWLGYYNGSIWTNLESPREFIPANMTPDQVREINAMTHIENELIDEACAGVLDYLKANGSYDNTDIFFTSDHGELQGDFGLMFKGPYHVDALMHVPLIWRPANASGIQPDEILDPVGHLDLAATFCEIAGIDIPDYVEGEPLPDSQATATEQNRTQVFTQWDSQHGSIDLHLRSVYHRDGWLYTQYEPGSLYQGTEGELYNMNADPQQYHNLWDDPGQEEIKHHFKTVIETTLTELSEPLLPRKAPV